MGDCVINSTHDMGTVRQLQNILAMPSLTLLTSLPASSLVADAMPRLVRFLAPLLSKQEQQINWVLDTEKRMSKGGAGNPQAPFVWLHVESADNFKDPETARILTQQLYQFLEEELGFKKDWVVINFVKMTPTHVGINGQTLKELLEG